MLDLETVERELIAKLGPSVIVAWDQPLGSGPDVPRLAVLMESADASGCAVAAADAVQAVVDWLDMQQSGARDKRVNLSQSEYLGTVIYEITMPAENGAAALVPAFCALNDWFIVATGADQIRNIADALWGMAPTLGEMPEMRAWLNRTEAKGTIAVAQPALAAQVVDAWLTDDNGVVRAWIDRWWLGAGSTSSKGRRTRLGIGMRPGAEPATVSVARVYGAGRAYGRLREGDVILGVNEHVLSLESPTQDLRRLVSDAPSRGEWVFRVRRDDRLIDVPVPANVPTRVSDSASSPLAALNQLTTLFESVEFSGLRVQRGPGDRWAAHLTLRFASDHHED
jgi:hypothetical protein